MRIRETSTSVSAQEARAWVLKLALIGIVSFVAAFVLLGVQLEAKLWLIDDHVFVNYSRALDDDAGHRLVGFFRVLAGNAEVVGLGVSARYRPVYATWRVAGTALWGTNPRAWYLMSMMMFAVFLASMLWVLQGLTGWLIGVLLTAYLLTHQYWGDVWARLGPAEQYASVGFGLFLVGAYTVTTKFLHREQGSMSGGIHLMTIGSVIAMGSKENFVIVLMPLMLVLAYGTYRRRLSMDDKLSLLVGIIIGIVIALSIVLALAKTGADSYGRSTAVGERLTLALTAGRWFMWPALATVPLAITGGIIARRRPGRYSGDEYWRLTLLTAVAMAVLVSVVVFQYMFYDGQWPTNMRYDFPGRALEPLFYAVVLWYGWHVRVLLDVPRGLAKIGLCAVGVGLVMLVLVGDIYNSRRAVLGRAPRTELAVFGGIPIRKAAAANTSRTQRFSVSLEDIIATVNANKRWPIILDSHSPWDWEPVLYIHRFLAVYGGTNPLFLRVHGYPDPSRGDFSHATLGKELLDVGGGGGRGMIRPLGELNDHMQGKGYNCFSIGFSGPAHPPCIPLELTWQ